MPGPTYPINLDATVGPLGVYRGDEWESPPFRFWDDAAKTVPTDLTAKFGPTWTAQARNSQLGAIAMVIDVDLTVRPGTVVLRAAGDVTALLVQRDTYLFDVQVTGGTRSPVTVLCGTLAMSGEVTQ